MVRQSTPMRDMSRTVISRATWLILAAVLLTGCGPFDPEMPFPDGDREVAIGIRVGIAEFSWSATADIDILGSGVTSSELVALATAVREVIAPTEGTVTVDSSGGSRFDNGSYLRASSSSAWVPAMEQSLDVPAIVGAVESLGMHMVYLHWCPPSNYEVRSTDPPSLLTSAFQCVLWKPETGVEPIRFTLGSERGALAPAIAALLICAIGAIWSIAELAIAGLRRRPIAWRTVRRGLGTWGVSLTAYGLFLVPFLPDPITIIRTESASSGIGGAVDVVAAVVSITAPLVGLIAIVLVLATASGSAIMRRWPRKRLV
jgi:hypothetical protein